MAPCCQNPEYRCTGPDYRLHSHTSTFAHGASVTVLGCSKKGGGGREEEEERITCSTKQCFGRLPVSHLKHASGNYKMALLDAGHSLMLSSYLFLCVTHLRQGLSHFTRNTHKHVHWLRWPFYFWVIPTYQHTSVVGNTIPMRDVANLQCQGARRQSTQMQVPVNWILPKYGWYNYNLDYSTSKYSSLIG